MTENEWTVEGFKFASEDDVKLAKAELNRIDQLEGKIDHKNPHLVSAVYEKAIENKIFKTPVGLFYMKSLQEEIKKSPLIQKKVSDIPVTNMFSEEKIKSRVSSEVKKEVRRASNKQEIFTKKISLILNAVLVCVIALLFYITLTSENPNILNYETNLQNKYASWNEELTQREQIIREKERNLSISSEQE